LLTRLITSQVINPLLSDQINSLLRSDMSLDIDFNLTTLNEIDLGVALRLYDDRLILRRDGVITGEYSDIGDLGATYRINRVFAVTAFHRQDPTLTSSSAAEVDRDRK
jgi:translocation and assembly module TamB